jgi:hypothetical protein
VKERTHANIKSLYFHKRHKEEVWLMMAVFHLQKKTKGGKEREGFRYLHEITHFRVK